MSAAMTKTKQHQGALDAVARGFRITPLSPNGKKPFLQNWPEHGLQTADEVNEMWARNPEYNYGIITGFYPEYGKFLCAVDVDNKNGKEGRLSYDLLSADCRLADTLETATPTGGGHFFFWADAALRQGADDIPGYPGIDMRSVGGQVVGPGSIVNGKEYRRVNETPIADVSPEFKKLIGTRRNKAKTGNTPVGEQDHPSDIAEVTRYLIEDAPPSIEGEGGDDTLFRVIAHCWDYNLSWDVLMELVAEHYNDPDEEGNPNKCEPPWSPEELEEKFEHVSRYKAKAPGMKQSAAAEFDDGVTLGEEPDGSPIDVGKTPTEKQADKLGVVCAADLLLTDPKPREWIVSGWLPARVVSLLYADGGTGKSLLSLQLGAAMSTGRPWLGLDAEQGACLVVSTEDDMDEMHRRLMGVAEMQGLDPSVFGKLNLLSLVGQDSVMASAAPGTDVLEKSQQFKVLRQTVKRLKPKLVVVDTVANVFGGNENSRTQVQQFVNIWNDLCQKFGTTVLLLAHPSRTGISSGTGDGGSTQWSNSVRNRWYMEPVVEPDGTVRDPKLRKLSIKKSNYGETGASMVIRWTPGGFYPRPEAVEDADEAARQLEIEDKFLEMLDRFLEANRRINTERGKFYAPHLFAEEDDAKRIGIKEGDFHDAMSRLLAKKLIKNVNRDRPSKPQYWLERVPK